MERVWNAYGIRISPKIVRIESLRAIRCHCRYRCSSRFEASSPWTARRLSSACLSRMWPPLLPAPATGKAGYPPTRASSASAAACCAARFEAARPSARAAVLEPRLHREDRRMVRSLAVEVEIGRRRQPARLRPFLQRGLGVAAHRPHRGEPLAPAAQDQRAAPPPARRRDRPPRSPPPSRRRGARSCAGRRSASPSAPSAAPPRGRAPPPPRRRSPCAPARSAAAPARPRWRPGPGRAAPRR